MAKQPSANELLKSYGGVISAQELQDFEKAGYSTTRAQNYAQDKSDVKLGDNAKTYINTPAAPAAAAVPVYAGGVTTTATDPSIGIAQIYATSNENVASISANAMVSAEGIRADADKYIADAYASAQRYGSELSLEGTKYSADKEAEWRQAVAEIETKGKLDLQPIINAGMEKVADIEAQASRDVADITGRYSVEGIKTKGQYDERLAKMQLAGGMYGLINAAFG